MKPIKVSFQITETLLKRLLSLLFILAMVIGVVVAGNHFIVKPVQQKLFENRDKYLACNETLTNSTLFLNSTVISLEQCRNESQENNRTLQASVAKFRSDYNTCNNLLGDKASDYSEAAKDLVECQDDLESMESQKNLYVSKYNSCDDDLDDCEASCP